MNRTVFYYRGRESQWLQKKGWMKQVHGFGSPEDAKEACEFYGWEFVCELEIPASSAVDRKG
jgi:hypothetical protein